MAWRNCFLVLAILSAVITALNASLGEYILTAIIFGNVCVNVFFALWAERRIRRRGRF